MSPGPIALVGSGEYLPVMADIEGMLLAGRAPRYVQIPTAAAPEGEQSLRRWLGLGAAQAGRLGVEQVPLVVRNRDEADEETALVDMSGTGRDWQVYGRQQVWVLGAGPRRGYPAGAGLRTP